MRYPQHFIDTLKSRFTVSEVVGKRVTLRRHGREYQGLCPFHKEKSPSFTVNDEKSFYHCFGCGAHGDAIGFIKEFEGVSYREAIERLAAEAGMEVPKPSAQDIVREETRKTLADVTEAACIWFEDQLQSTAGYQARIYLQERGITSEAMQRFRIGYAPNDRESLKKYLLNKGFTEDQMVETGMLIKVEGKAPYSRFRDRLMFPIRDRASKVVAFGGRIMPNSSNSDAPKYLNSPETELFKKGSMLYNFDLARRAAFDAGELVVCEGYMDVIALWQAGMHYAVAPLGTAVTPLQLQQLWQVCDVPTFCLDGDSAGERAMVRASELALPLLQPGKSLAFIRLPKGEDPDSLLQHHGSDAMHQQMRQAVGLAQTLWNQVTADGAATPDDRARQEHVLLKLADQIQDVTVKSHYRTYFKDQLWQQRGAVSQLKVKGNNGRPAIHKTPQRPAQPLPIGPALQCLKLALLYPQLLRDGRDEEAFACMETADTMLDQLRQTILLAIDESLDISRADLLRIIQTNGQEPLFDQIMQMQEVSIPKSFLHDTDDAQFHQAKRMWMQAMHAYQASFIQRDYARAEAEMARNMTDESYERFMELKKQLQALERERAQLYVQEMMG